MNVCIVVAQGDDSAERPTVAAFSSQQKAKAWAYGQTKNFDFVNAFEVVVDTADTDAEWDDICQELI